MTSVRVLFAGTPDVAVPALDLLVADGRFEVVAALTNPDRPRGRSGDPVPSPVARRALELGLRVLRPERVRDAAAEIRATGADVGAVVAYGSILPPAVLGALPLGFVNLHFSLLPRWRGAAPVQHAIRAGDAVTGVTAFRLDEGMDTGPVLRRLELRPPDDVDAGDLLDALAVEGAPVLADALAAVAAGERGIEQAPDGVTLAPRIGPEDAEVVWGEPAVEVARRIRSVTPRPGASTWRDGERMKVAGVRVVDVPDRPGLAGEVLGTDGDAVVVACGVGAVRIGRVQLPGRAWSAAADQVRGRRLTLGAVLGAGAPRS
jgi:methionyl-tRNA formyltransferase